MVKRKETTPNKEKEKIQKLDFDIKEDEKEFFESLIEKFMKKNILPEIKSKAKMISIEIEKKNKKELVEELSYNYLLISRLPIDLKLLIISFLSVEMKMNNWLGYEMNRLQGVHDSKTPSFYRDCFGCFDSSRKPYFIFQNLFGDSINNLLCFYSKEELESDESRAYIELYKCICKFTKYIDHGFENYLEKFSQIHFNIVKHFHFKKMKVRFDHTFNILKSLDLSSVTYLKMECFYDFYDITELSFPKLTDLKMNNFGYKTNFTMEEEESLLDYIKSLKLTSLVFDILPKNPLKVVETVQAQKQLKNLEIHYSIFSLFNILEINFEKITLNLYHPNIIYLNRIQFSKSLKVFKAISNRAPENIMKNIQSIENIEFIDLQCLFNIKIPITNEVKNFLKLCNQSKVTLKTNFNIPLDIRNFYSDINFIK